MKKLFYSIFAICVLLAACNNQDDFESTMVNDTESALCTNAKIRSISDARHIAELVAGNSAIGSRSKSTTDTHVILGRQSRSGESDTLLYAVDFENDGGFVLIAAPQNADPVVAIIDEGSFDDPANLTNEPYQAVLSQIKTNMEIMSSSGPNRPVDPDTSKLILIPMYYYDTIDIKRIQEPSIKVAWNQDWPENIYAPNKIAGCVPVAMGQLLSAFEKPQFISYTFPNADITSEILDWNEIKKHKHSSIFDNFCLECNANTSTHYSIGRFIRQLGHQAHADYSSHYSTGVLTGAYIEDIIYGYTSTKPNDKHRSLSDLYSKLLQGGAAIVDFAGSNSQSRHAFIADGANYMDYTIFKYVHISGGEYRQEIEKIIQIHNIHYNWGWGGNCNGWFSLSAVDPMNSEEYDYPNDLNYYSHEYDKNSILYWYYKL